MGPVTVLRAPTLASNVVSAMHARSPEWEVAAELRIDMERCTIGLFTGAVLGVLGSALAYAYRRRAIRYRSAFERAFAIARRVYNFTDDERSELTQLIGEPLERPRREGNR